jgi:uncharacterized protein (TIGR00251 family)
MTLEIAESKAGLSFVVQVVPRASSSEIAGTLDGLLKVRIASPPVGGAANAELIRFLAKALRLPKRDIEIISGSASKKKRILIRGIARPELEKRLCRSLE